MSASHKSMLEGAPRMESQNTVALEEALRIVDETLTGVKLPGETIPLGRALGRVLCADVSSRVDLPPFNKSAMDGYAILEDDERQEYRLLGTVAAGDVCSFELTPGTAVKVMTGAPVPERTGLVVMVERTEEQGGTVKVHRHGGKPNICLQAEDVRTGDTIMTAGTTLGALEIGNLVSCGIAPRRSGDDGRGDPHRAGPGRRRDRVGRGLGRRVRFRSRCTHRYGSHAALLPRGRKAR